MKRLFQVICFILVTALTQLGGVVWLLSLPLLLCIRMSSRWQQRLVRAALLLGVYTLTVLVIVPPLASLTGRVALPCFADKTTPLAAVNAGYCLLMRNYVTPPVRRRLIKHAQRFRQIHPGSTVRYLDAGFPFGKGFPLLPHLSHKDGKKVDLAYFYRLKATQQAVHVSPSWLGYWVYEQALTPETVVCQGQRSLLRWDFESLQARYAAYEIDEERTRTLLRLLTEDAEKILLEPHLKQRLGVDSALIRFQGCYAARHDDHLHVQWP